MTYVRIIAGAELRVGDRINGRAVLTIAPVAKPHPTLGAFRAVTVPADTPSGRATMSVFNHQCITVDADEEPTLP